MAAVDIFSDAFVGSLEERAGSILKQKDLKEERHDLKKTSKEVFDDFMHNVTHPFMTVLRKEAARYAKSGAAFSIHNRIPVLIDDEESDERALYYNDGDTWRQSGNALIAKYLKELYPELHTPGMKFGCMGEQELLDAYPGRFQWVRDIYQKRAKKEED